MRGRAVLAVLCLAAEIASSIPARAEDAQTLYDRAQKVDLSGARGDAAASAFALYKRAAEAGLPQAEFNVAVMLDSGRGTPPDVGQAATWYARAALHGERRAAFNLGQLYEAGEGVPKNDDLARAWFSTSDLPAARARLARQPASAPTEASLSAPTPIVPAAGQSVDPAIGGLALVWTSRAQPEPVRFFVELRALDPGGSREVFSGFSDTSGLLVDKPPTAAGEYAWRALAVTGNGERYALSAWTRFNVSPAKAPDGVASVPEQAPVPR